MYSTIKLHLKVHKRNAVVNLIYITIIVIVITAYTYHKISNSPENSRTGCTHIRKMYHCCEISTNKLSDIASSALTLAETSVETPNESNQSAEEIQEQEEVPVSIITPELKSINLE